MRIAVVEDEQETAEEMQKHLQRYAGENQLDFEITWYPDAIEFLRHWKGQYQLLFLDILMPEMDGLELAARVRETDEEVAIIFVTNMAKYAIRGYEVNALDFILKPVEYYGFSLKMKRALRYLERFTEKKISIQTAGGVRRIAVNEIQYIEVRAHYLYFYLGQEVIESRGTMSQIEEALTDYSFIRCNNYTLVNLSAVSGVRDNQVEIGENRIPVTRSRKKLFLQKLAEFWGDGVG